jgi:hypothetical protein
VDGAWAERELAAEDISEHGMWSMKGPLFSDDGNDRGQGNSP